MNPAWAEHKKVQASPNSSGRPRRAALMLATWAARVQYTGRSQPRSDAH